MTAPPADDDRAGAPDAARRATLEALAERIGYRFQDLGLLDRALVHASSNQDGQRSYERLEFLGDAVLGYIVAAHLFKTDLAASEGELTRRRAEIVSRVALARVSRRLRLTELLHHGRGLRDSELRSERIQADLVEAVLGAILRDGGIRPAQRFVRRHVLAEPPEPGPDDERPSDPKSLLLHRAQALGRGQPSYVLVDADGPDHARDFRIAAELAGERIAEARGRSKRAAEMAAAEAALRILPVPGDEAPA